MSLGLILIIILLLIMVGALPRWPHSMDWGYRPTGLVGTLLLIVIILMLLNAI